MRLIDIDAFREEFGLAERCEDCIRRNKKDCDYQWYSARDFCGWLDDFPTVDAPTVELTDEAAIEHLQASGWMQNHDREMMRVQWISVKDRLPEPQAQCLVYSAKASRPRGMETATYTGLGWMMAAYFPEITHWMPLLEPPEEDTYGSGTV